MRRTLAPPLTGLVTALVLAAPPIAAGAPARNATLSAASPTFAWEDGPRDGAGSDVANPLPMCTDPGFYCDETLLKLEAVGTLEVRADASGEVRPDIDLYLYRSDAQGAAGRQVKISETPNPDERIVVEEIEPGYYLVRAAYYSGINVTYKGTATLSFPPANQPPRATIAKLPASGTASRFRRFSGTATDDGEVAKVEVGLLRIQGNRCTELTAAGSFRRASSCRAPRTFLAATGAASWSFRLRRALAKGSYRVFARAVDADGVVQAEFGSTSRRSFRVR
jgi:hypothetical protein